MKTFAELAHMTFADMAREVAAGMFHAVRGAGAPRGHHNGRRDRHYGQRYGSGQRHAQARERARRRRQMRLGTDDLIRHSGQIVQVAA